MAFCERGGIKTYYLSKIDELEKTINEKSLNLRRLEAQRNELNSRVRLLREELQLLQEPGSYVGEVAKAMGKKKVLVKVKRAYAERRRTVSVTGSGYRLTLKASMSSTSTNRLRSRTLSQIFESRCGTTATHFTRFCHPRWIHW